MGAAGILVAAAGGLAVVLGGVVGIPTNVHLVGDLTYTEYVTNLPTLIIGGIGVITGAILFAADAVVGANMSRRRNALMKYDDEIAMVVEKLKPLGQKWVDEFVHSYVVLNDKSYLPSLVQKIIAGARAERDAAVGSNNSGDAG